ncbi:hypothetical protein NFI96_025547 [Prochilodus magdalenae]|nr:hypothetical protein NFI96_025547 [Prochilodus magdalenae]
MIGIFWNTGRISPKDLKPASTDWEKMLACKARDAAFRSGDREAYSSARANLRKGISMAKHCYKQRIEEHFSSSDPRRMWQDIQTRTDYKPRSTVLANCASLLDELNHFYARFDRENMVVSSKTDPPLHNHPLTLSTLDVHHTLSRVNIRSAAGPDKVPGRVLRACAHELSGVFAHIFNLSLAQAAVPTIFKTATIVPVPKHPTASAPNDFRPVALTPIISKCFERLVLSHLKSCLPATLDPHQFAYRSNRSTEDAISTALHTALTHLDCQNSYVRMLFIDFSAAFNTVIPSKLITKLNHLGCVLSPILYSLFTHDCVPIYGSNTIIKYADDTTVIDLIKDNDETAYRDEHLGPGGTLFRFTVYCTPLLNILTQFLQMVWGGQRWSDTMEWSGLHDSLSCVVQPSANGVAGTFSLLVPDGFISARIGSSVVLPCGLSITLDIKSYEVNWHRPDQLENPVLLYKNQMVQENTGDPQYRGRVSLIGELETGNASLKVENLTLADRGEYVCFVKSTEWYERASVNLNITASVGLESVSSWILVSPSGSEWISCSVGLSDHEMEGRVLPPKMVYNPDSVNDPDSTLESGLSSGWKAFTILLVISLLVFTVIAFIPKIRDRISPKESKPASPVSEISDKGTNTEKEIPDLLVRKGGREWGQMKLERKEDKFTVLVPRLALAEKGSSVILPCGLSPFYNAKTFEVRWYRNEDYNHPILFYENEDVQKNAGDPRYRDRVSLIGNLEEGNASLKLEKLTLIDSGEYTCHVESTQWYDRANVTLIVQVLGAVPVLLFTHAGEQVNITCVSGGWSPKPTVIWRNKQGRELGTSTGHYKTDSEGLVSVSSWLLSSPSESEWLSCSVGLSNQEMNEGRVLPPKLAYKPDPVDDSDLTLEPGESKTIQYTDHMNI